MPKTIKPTMETKQDNNWVERFEIAWNNDFDSDYSNNIDPEKIKSFIQTEIDKAVEEDRKLLLFTIRDYKKVIDVKNLIKLSIKNQL